MKLEYSEYYRRLSGCFIGKSVGGTLGMPYEGEERLLDLTFYDPVPTEMVANDDLDLQVMALEAVRRNGLPIHRKYLGDFYLKSLRFACDEYGVARRNLTHGIFPPLSGYYDNKFTGGMGSAIRSEIWGCLAPGDPALAAALAREDSCIDHTDDGLEATMFLAAIESAAFVETDIDRLIDIALGYVTDNGRFACAIRDTKVWWNECRDFVEVRRRILDKYYVQNWTDVSINISFVVLGLLAGEGDFGKTICTAVNCGNDTDCTGATLGALYGIMYPERITEEWTAPIGNRLVVGGNMLGLHEVDTIDKFCEQIAAVSIDVQKFYGSSVTTENYPEFPEYAVFEREPWCTPDENIPYGFEDDPHESVLAIMPLYTSVFYPEDIAIGAGETKQYRIRFRGRKKAETFRGVVSVPNGFAVEPSRFELSLEPQKDSFVTVSVTRSADAAKNPYFNPMDIRLIGENETIELTAQLPLCTSWVMKPTDTNWNRCPSLEELSGSKRVEAPYHFVKVPAGHWLLSTCVKDPVGTRNAFLVAEGTRKIKVWINDKLVQENDGSYYVPAFHRGPLRRRVNLSGWSRITVEVLDGNEGEVFIGLGTPYGFDWLFDIENRLPGVAVEE